MKNHIYMIGLSALMLLASGCSSSKGIQVNPNLTTYGRQDLESGEMKLPANTSTDNFRKILMGVNFSDISRKAGDISNESVKTLSSRLQTEMAKLKRFSIFSAHNRGGVNIFKQLADVDEANMTNLEEREMAALDYVLSGSVTITKEKQARYDYDELIYEVECDFSCEELKTKTVVFAEKAKGRSIRTQAFSLSGKQIGGFNLEDEKQAIYAAAMKAIAVVANKLGNTFPVGGKVIGVSRSGSRFSFDKGFEQGIGKDSQVILYVNDGGVDIPLAASEATPKKSGSCSAKIYRWNESDEDAEMIIEDIRNGKWKNYKLYAVQYGMPIPPEWENAYKGEK